jgi:translation elongation factor EF-Tu-like GTPase
MCPAPVEPGETAEVGVELIYPAVDYSALRKGAKFRVIEGERSVGDGVVLESFEEK